ncbi:MAG: tetratricopeptide repeat protein [Bradymonadia bacterium]
MGRSLYRPEMVRAIENFEPGAATVRHQSGLSYRALIDEEGRWWQVEYGPGPSGQAEEIQRVQVRHVIGSGNHTRSYLGEMNGQVVQLPLTWYVRSQTWDMSPGYRAEKNFRFDRPVKADCLFCHNAFTPSDDRTLAGYTAPLAEGISCSRCHGDGSAHVRQRNAGESPPDGQPDPNIFNPRHLTPDRQLQLCAQCHLQGSARVLAAGARWDVYDPRTPLGEYMTLFIDEARSGGAEFGIAGHGERLAMSKCAQGERPLVCTTCHDPHRRASPKAARAACLGCHTPQDCGEQHAAEGSCAGCHLPKGPTVDIPHVQFTDHYIRRRPDASTPARPRREGLRAVVSPAAGPSAASRLLAHVELWRANASAEHRDAALALAPKAFSEQPRRAELRAVVAPLRASVGDGAGALQAWDEALRLAGDSAPHTWALGRAEHLIAQGDLPRAERALRALIDAPLPAPHAWSNLANLLQRTGRHAEAEQAYAKALTLRPADGVIASNRGVNLMALGDKGAAFEWLKRALTLDPSNGGLRYNLAAQQLFNGDREAASATVSLALEQTKDFAPLWLLKAQLEIDASPKAALTSVARYQAMGGAARPEVYLLSALAHKKSGQIEQARAAAHEGRVRFPRDGRFTSVLKGLGP